MPARHDCVASRSSAVPGERRPVAGRKALNVGLATCRIMVGVLIVVHSFSTRSVWAADDNWPQWRGTLMTGVSPTATLPSLGARTTNIKWKVRIPGRGLSRRLWSGAIRSSFKRRFPSPRPRSMRPKTPAILLRQRRTMLPSRILRARPRKTQWTTAARRTRHGITAAERTIANSFCCVSTARPERRSGERWRVKKSRTKERNSTSTFASNSR